jgi:cation/acetate symporter
MKESHALKKDLIKRSVGSLVSLVSMVVVSLMTAAPDSATQKMVDDVRVPSGKTVLGKQH